MTEAAELVRARVERSTGFVLSDEQAEAIASSIATNVSDLQAWINWIDSQLGMSDRDAGKLADALTAFAQAVPTE